MYYFAAISYSSDDFGEPPISTALSLINLCKKDAIRFWEETRFEDIQEWIVQNNVCSHYTAEQIGDTTKWLVS